MTLSDGMPTTRPRWNRSHPPDGDRGRAVVTGGAGFIGSHLCAALLQRGFDVFCLDDLTAGSRENIADLIDTPGFEFIQCDVAIGLPVRGPVDVVFHAAFPENGFDHVTMPMETLQAISAGTMRALDFADVCDCRFVLVSSADVYGSLRSGPRSEHDFTESDGCDPCDPTLVYPLSRRYSETLTVAHRANLGLDAAIVRVFNAYGPHMPGGGTLARFIREAIEGRPLVIPGSGTRVYSLCHVTDVVRGILDVAATSTPGPVNLGDAVGVPLAALATLVAAKAGAGSTVEYVTFPTEPPRVRVPDTRLAEQLIGWRPQMSLPDGVATTVASMRTSHPVAA